MLWLMSVPMFACCYAVGCILRRFGIKIGREVKTY